MASDSYNQLRADVGLVDLTECTPQENERFAEMEKNGGELPKDVCRAAEDDADKKPRYYRCTSKTLSEKEELYVLMKISKDLNIIKVILEVSLALSIISIVFAILY